MDTDILAGDSEGSLASLTSLGSDLTILLVVNYKRFTAYISAEVMIRSHDPDRAAKDGSTNLRTRRPRTTQSLWSHVQLPHGHFSLTSHLTLRALHVMHARAALFLLLVCLVGLE